MAKNNRAEVWNKGFINAAQDKAIKTNYSDVDANPRGWHRSSLQDHWYKFQETINFIEAGYHKEPNTE